MGDNNTAFVRMFASVAESMLQSKKIDQANIRADGLCFRLMMAQRLGKPELVVVIGQE